MQWMRALKRLERKYEDLMGGNEKILVDHAEDGARRAQEIAEHTMERVRSAMGMGW